MKYFLTLFLLISSVANAQLTLQGTSSINEQLNLEQLELGAKV